MSERIFECYNCAWHGAEDATREARDVATRHECGDRYSDRECPKCGGLAFPWEDGAASSAPAVPALATGPKAAAPVDPTPESMAREAESLLRRARDLLAKAGAPRAADKVRAAIKSAGGAVRHAEARADRARNAEGRT